MSTIHNYKKRKETFAPAPSTENLFALSGAPVGLSITDYVNPWDHTLYQYPRPQGNLPILVFGLTPQARAEYQYLYSQVKGNTQKKSSSDL